MAMNSMTMATLMNTINAFTKALSCVPLMSNKVRSSRMNRAGAFIMPWWATPAESV